MKVQILEKKYRVVTFFCDPCALIKIDAVTLLENLTEHHVMSYHNETFMII